MLDDRIGRSAGGAAESAPVPVAAPLRASSRALRQQAAAASSDHAFSGPTVPAPAARSLAGAASRAGLPAAAGGVAAPAGAAGSRSPVPDVSQPPERVYRGTAAPPSRGQRLASAVRQMGEAPAAPSGEDAGRGAATGPNRRPRTASDSRDTAGTASVMPPVMPAAAQQPHRQQQATPAGAPQPGWPRQAGGCRGSPSVASPASLDVPLSCPSRGGRGRGSPTAAAARDGLPGTAPLTLDLSSASGSSGYSGRSRRGDLPAPAAGAAVNPCQGAPQLRPGRHAASGPGDAVSRAGPIPAGDAADLLLWHRAAPLSAPTLERWAAESAATPRSAAQAAAALDQAADVMDLTLSSSPSLPLTQPQSQAALGAVAVLDAAAALDAGVAAGAEAALDAEDAADAVSSPTEEALPPDRTAASSQQAQTGASVLPPPIMPGAQRSNAVGAADSPPLAHVHSSPRTPEVSLGTAAPGATASMLASLPAAGIARGEPPSGSPAEAHLTAAEAGLQLASGLSPHAVPETPAGSAKSALSSRTAHVGPETPAAAAAADLSTAAPGASAAARFAAAAAGNVEPCSAPAEPPPSTPANVHLQPQGSGQPTSSPSPHAVPEAPTGQHVGQNQGPSGPHPTSGLAADHVTPGGALPAAPLLLEPPALQPPSLQPPMRGVTAPPAPEAPLAARRPAGDSSWQPEPAVQQQHAASSPPWSTIPPSPQTLRQQRCAVRGPAPSAFPHPPEDQRREHSPLPLQYLARSPASQQQQHFSPLRSPALGATPDSPQGKQRPRTALRSTPLSVIPESPEAEQQQQQRTQAGIQQHPAAPLGPDGTPRTPPASPAQPRAGAEVEAVLGGAAAAASQPGGPPARQPPPSPSVVDVRSPPPSCVATATPPGQQYAAGVSVSACSRMCRRSGCCKDTHAMARLTGVCSGLHGCTITHEHACGSSGMMLTERWSTAAAAQPALERRWPHTPGSP